MSKTDALEEAWLKLFFNATAMAGIADNAASSPATVWWISLHTADPGEDGDQETNEATYTGYNRVSVARTSGGWTVTGNSVSPTSDITFPQATGGSETITHIGIGRDETDAGLLYWKGALSPTIAVSSGVTPRLTSASTIIED